MTSVIRSTRPLLVLLAALNYLLGIAAADYLGLEFRAGVAWLGLCWVVLLQASTGILTEAFRPLTEQADPPLAMADRLAFRNRLTLTAAVMLTAAAGTTLAMTRYPRLVPIALGIEAVGLALALMYAIPPPRLVHSGFGELVQSILLAGLPAALAYVLQAGEFHRLVGFTTFALILLGLAWRLALDFPTFASDQKYGKRTLLRQIGWERAVPLHQAVLLAAFGLLLLSPAIGVSLSLMWPGLLTLPFAVLQALLVRGIAVGGRPNWPLLTATSTAVFGLTTYFLTLSFWIR